MNNQQDIVVRSGGYARKLDRLEQTTSEVYTALTKSQAVAKDRRLNLLCIYGELIQCCAKISSATKTHGELFHLDLPPLDLDHSKVDDAYIHAIVRLGMKRFTGMMLEMLEYVTVMENKIKGLESSINLTRNSVQSLPGHSEIPESLFSIGASDNVLQSLFDTSSVNQGLPQYFTDGWNLDSNQTE